MFTGLVQDVGTIGEAQSDGDGTRLSIETRLAPEIGEGDSVAVNGVCLTATRVDADGFGVDVMRETLSRSSLGAVAAGGRVNLELSLRASDRLGGHIMQGHVDGLGEVLDVQEDGFARIVTVRAPPQLLRYVVEKGSIAVDGVSLTVTAAGDDRFSVSLIPETLERTTLGNTEPGALVNLEVDVVAKYVEKLLARGAGHAAVPSAERGGGEPAGRDGREAGT